MAVYIGADPRWSYMQQQRMDAAFSDLLSSLQRKNKRESDGLYDHLSMMAQHPELASDSYLDELAGRAQKLKDPTAEAFVNSLRSYNMEQQAKGVEFAGLFGPAENPRTSGGRDVSVGGSEKAYASLPDWLMPPDPRQEYVPGFSAASFSPEEMFASELSTAAVGPPPKSTSTSPGLAINAANRNFLGLSPEERFRALQGGRQVFSSEVLSGIIGDTYDQQQFAGTSADVRDYLMQGDTEKAAAAMDVNAGLAQTAGERARLHEQNRHNVTTEERMQEEANARIALNEARRGKVLAGKAEKDSGPTYGKTDVKEIKAEVRGALEASGIVQSEKKWEKGEDGEPGREVIAGPNASGIPSKMADEISGSIAKAVRAQSKNPKGRNLPLKDDTYSAEGVARMFTTLKRRGMTDEVAGQKISKLYLLLARIEDSRHPKASDLARLDRMLQELSPFKERKPSAGEEDTGFAQTSAP